MTTQNEYQETRESGMMIAAGMQGVGKTYQNMHTIANYVRDKLNLRVKGRKCLIFDTNGEYTKEQFEKNGIPNFNPKLIALKDITKWIYSPTIECRRIDAKNVSITDKIKILELLIKVCRNCMLVVEDINTYILNITHMEQVVSGLVNLRHRAVDILVSYQSLRAVEPRMFANSRWIRMHYQTDSVNDITSKGTNKDLMRIAQILVNRKYMAGDTRFFLYISNGRQKIEGRFSRKDFLASCREYVRLNKGKISDYSMRHNVAKNDAVEGAAKELFSLYFGNAAA